MTLKALVTGATGKQGGAVARRLMERGHHVRALSRKPDSAAAQALGRLGAEVVDGSFEDSASIARALEGMDAIFAMSTPFEAGTEVEARQGVTLADAAKTAGKFLVYTSVGSADQGTGIPHFESKHAVERHIREIGVEATILAPVYFMENAIAFSLPQLKEGVYATPLEPTTRLAQIALADIAACAVSVLENRAKYSGKRYDLAGDEVSGNDAVQILSRVTGKKFSYFKVPMDQIRAMSSDMAVMYEWFERVGYRVDRQALRREFPDVGWHDYESWAKSQDWAKLLGP